MTESGPTTAPTVYTAGPDDGTGWRTAVRELGSMDVYYLDPFDLSPDGEDPREWTQAIHHQDTRHVRLSQAVLCKRISGYNLCGAAMECQVAFDAGIPVVVYNDGEDPIPLMLEAVADTVCESLEDAVSTVEQLASDRSV